MKVYIHIGGAKTGSTAIQKMLFQNANVLLRNNYVYHHFNRKDSHELALALGFGQTKTKRLFPNIKIDEKETINHLKTRLTTDKNHIISSEVFSIATTKTGVEKLIALFKEFEVVIVYYLRNQAEQTESAYQQLVKEGYTNTIEVFAKNHKISFKNNLGFFKEFVPSDNFIIRYYERENFIDNNLFADFLTSIDLHDLKSKIRFPKKSETNQSLSKDCTEILRVCNAKLPDLKTKIYNDLERLSQKDKDQFDYFSENEKNVINAKFNEELSWVKDTFLEKNSTQTFTTTKQEKKQYEGLQVRGLSKVFMGLLKGNHQKLKNIETELEDYLNYFNINEKE